MLFLFFAPVLALADYWQDMQDVLRKFRPRITVQEEYTDNFFLTHDNTKGDFITTILPGVNFNLTENKETKYGLELDYSPGFVFYADHSDLNYISHEGKLNTWYSFSPGLTLRVTDYYIRSENPLEQYVVNPVQIQPGIYYLGVQRQRSIYTRNVFEPSLTYQFGREDRVELFFQDTAYTDQSPTVENSHGDNINPRLTYWFDIHNGIIFEYRYQMIDFQRSPDFKEHYFRGRYTYRFTPRTSIFAEHSYDTLDFKSPGVDYYTNNPSIGITHAFSPTLTGRAQAGYFWRKLKSGGTNDGLSFDAGITQRTVRTTYDLAAQGGYLYDYMTPQNLGFTKFYRVIGTVTHELGPRTNVGLVGTVGYYTYSDQNRNDWIWRAEGFAAYRFLRWLTGELRFYHTEDDSSVSTQGYKENRATVRLTATYW